jgi:hypothetical protein
MRKDLVPSEDLIREVLRVRARTYNPGWEVQYSTPALTRDTSLVTCYVIPL